MLNDRIFRILVLSALRASIDFQSLTANRMREPSMAIIPAYNWCHSVLVNILRVVNSECTSAGGKKRKKRRTKGMDNWEPCGLGTLNSTSPHSNTTAKSSTGLVSWAFRYRLRACIM